MEEEKKERIKIGKLVRFNSIPEKFFFDNTQSIEAFRLASAKELYAKYRDALKDYHREFAKIASAKDKNEITKCRIIVLQQDEVVRKAFENYATYVENHIYILRIKHFWNKHEQNALIPETKCDLCCRIM